MFWEVSIVYNLENLLALLMEESSLSKHGVSNSGNRLIFEAVPSADVTANSPLS